MKCADCRWFHKENEICLKTGNSIFGIYIDNKCEYVNNMTVFEKITASPEVLAEYMVYHDGDYEIAFTVVSRGKEQKMGHECWRSTIIPGDCWDEYDKAYAATVAKLKEVNNG